MMNSPAEKLCVGTGAEVEVAWIEEEDGLVREQAQIQAVCCRI
jgi:hypothetical protein